MRLPKKFARKSRKVFYWIHLWTGLILGLWLVLMGLTGSLLSWKSEIMEWEVRQRGSAPAVDANAPKIPVSKAIAALKAYDESLTPERAISLPARPTGYYMHSARSRGEGGKRATRLFVVNPVTAQVYPPVLLGSTWIDYTEQFHHNLLVGVKGTVTNGFFTFFTVFMLLSGIWLWWPSTIKQLKQRLWLKRGQSLYRTLYDLHNISGVYLYGLLFVITITGLVICYNGQTDQSIRKGINRMAGVSDGPLRRLTDEAPAVGRRGREGGREREGGRGTERDGGRGGERGRERETEDRGEPLPVDVMVEKARAAWPSRTLVSIRVPRRPGQPFQATYDFFSLTNGSVPFDPYTGERLTSDGRRTTPGADTMSVMFQLHYGWFAGNWSKWIYFISGFLPLALFVTGVWMYFNKKKTQAKKKLAKAKAQPVKKKAATQTEEAKVEEAEVEELVPA